MSAPFPRPFPRLLLAPAAAFTVLAVRGQALAATAPAGTAVDQGRAWWLLVPMVVAVGCWWWLSGREETIGCAVVTTGATTTDPPPVTHRAEAVSRDGVVDIRAEADPTAPVVRQLRNGATFQITGKRRRDATKEDWLEVSGGGWVRDDETRYDRYIVR